MEIQCKLVTQLLQTPFKIPVKMLSKLAIATFFHIQPHMIRSDLDPNILYCALKKKYPSPVVPNY